MVESLWEVEKGNQKGRIANFGGNERNHHQERQKIVLAGQEGNQKWLLQETNWISHEEWIERQKGTMGDGLPNQA